jgi:ribonuclease P protein component
MPPGPPKRLRFPRSARIKQGRDFARARQEGQRCVCGCLIANWRVLPEGNSTRLGLVVSRKVGGAVVRSRARRLLRETFRLHQRELARPVDLVLVARQSIANHGRSEVEKDFLTTMKRAGLLSTPSEVRGGAPERREGGSAG